MAYVDFKRGYVRFKLVYYGPEKSGKTANLEHLSKMNSEKEELIQLGTDEADTGHFEHLPLNLGRIRSIDTMLKMYTVPGGEQFNKTRQMVLKDVDGVVFVVDSSEAMLDDNILSLQNLEENLSRRNISLFDLPVIIQYNKRDMADALPVEKLEGNLNPYGWPRVEATVSEGKGIKETLTQITQLIYEQTASKYTLVPSVAPAMVVPEESEAPEPVLERPTEPEPAEDVPSKLEQAQSEDELKPPALPRFGEAASISKLPLSAAIGKPGQQPPPLPKQVEPEEEFKQESDLEELELKEEESEDRPIRARRAPPPGKLSRKLAAHIIKSLAPPPALGKTGEPGPTLPKPTQTTGGELEPLLSELEKRLLKRMDLLEVCMQHLDKKHEEHKATHQNGVDSPSQEALVESVYGLHEKMNDLISVFDKFQKSLDELKTKIK